jgi:DNA processing protein
MQGAPRRGRKEGIIVDGNQNTGAHLKVAKHERTSQSAAPKAPRVLLPAPTKLLPADPGYPRKLLFVQLSIPLDFVGNPELLSHHAIAIIGSRFCSERGSELANQIAKAAAECGITVVSGYAKGVDTAAHAGALGGRGGTVFVLPFGMGHFRLKREIRPSADPSRFLAISQFPAHQRWFAHAAMQRNRLVCALADAVLVVEAGDQGGTMEGARVAKELGKRLYVIQYEFPPPSASGNKRIKAELGAKPLQSWADVRMLLRELNCPNEQLPLQSPAVQQSLF